MRIDSNLFKNNPEKRRKLNRMLTASIKNLSESMYHRTERFTI